MRFISSDTLRELITMPEAIVAMQSAFSALSDGSAVVPLRTTLDFPGSDARALIMPAYHSSSQYFTTKIVTVCPTNAARHLPLIHGTLIVTDGSTGKTLALMDAEWITALRTGAASGLATEWMALPDAHTLGVFGTGAQAYEQVRGVLSVRKLTRIIIFGRYPQKTTTFCKTISNQFAIPCFPAQTPQEVSQCDILCCATNAHNPVFEDKYLTHGTHINGIGAFKPAMREIPSATIARARIIVDQRASAWREAGDLILAQKEGVVSEDCIAGEIGEVVTHKASGRISREQITIFKSVGNAIQDNVIASMAYERTLKAGVGTEI
ncbi:MAG TPA: ornithine cyclodeaminase [bacterium]|nr:ornithine cyclodeaminase [bacterium]HMY35639.1 ornithine cyclodeaminase [bacterium]HMZ04639.1 ornithine cyclodeaminase [bacterium]HNB09785.1 ornithine cyclodeaminase [bacterium]HNB56148.1 ornithine cyclodeaminase [bacterium]